MNIQSNIGNENVGKGKCVHLDHQQLQYKRPEILRVDQSKTYCEVSKSRLGKGKCVHMT